MWTLVQVHHVGCLQFDQLFLILALLLAHDSLQLGECFRIYGPALFFVLSQGCTCAACLCARTHAMPRSALTCVPHGVTMSSRRERSLSGGAA